MGLLGPLEVIGRAEPRRAIVKHAFTDVQVLLRVAIGLVVSKHIEIRPGVLVGSYFLLISDIVGGRQLRVFAGANTQVIGANRRIWHQIPRSGRGSMVYTMVHTYVNPVLRRTPAKKAETSTRSNP